MRRLLQRREDEDDNYQQMLGATSTVTIGENKPLTGCAENTVRLLLLGKTGCGKSSTGNTILGKECFSTSPDFGSVTSACDRHVGVRAGTRYEIMDSPGLYDTHKSQEEICTIIVQAVAGVHPGPHAVLNVVKVGRFTEEDFDAYRRLKMLFNDNIVRHMILLFTHGDDLARKGTTLEDTISSPNTPDKLKQVLKEVEHRYLLFDNTAKDTQPQVDKLLMAVRKLVAQNGGRPYCCPKYSKIGEGLEQEVNKRVEEFEKRDLQRQKYVQQLEKETRLAQQKANRTQEEFLRKEQEREEQMRVEEEQKNKLEKDLVEKLKLVEHNILKQEKEVEKLRKDRARQEEQERQMKERGEYFSKDEERLKEEMRQRERIMLEQFKQLQLDVEQQRREEREERRRLEKERDKLRQEQEEQRRRDLDEVEKRRKEELEQKEKQMKQEKEDMEKKEKLREKEMEELKDRIAKHEEIGVVKKFTNFVKDRVNATCGFFFR